MESIIVFNGPLFDFALDAVDKSVKTAAAKHGLTAHCLPGMDRNPAFVAVEESAGYITPVARKEIYDTAVWARNKFAPRKPEPTATEIEFQRLDDACKWGVATTQEREKRDAMASKAVR